MSVKSEVHNDCMYPKGYKERDLWHASIGENIGFEEDGKGKTFDRPVLILRAFNKQFCCVVPLSTTGKRGKFYCSFDGGTGKVSVALLSQIRTIDTSRLRHKIGVCKMWNFLEIKRKIRKLFRL
jgi:mRNA interferase MazF